MSTPWDASRPIHLEATSLRDQKTRTAMREGVVTVPRADHPSLGRGMRRGAPVHAASTPRVLKGPRRPPLPPAPGRPLLRGAGGVVARGPEPVAPPPPLPPARARTSLRRHRGVQYRSRRCPR